MFEQFETIYADVPDDLAGWLAAQQLSLTIGGADAAAAEEQVIHPASGKPIASYPQSGAEHVDAAVMAADRAFAGWSRTPVAERRRMLEQFADILWERRVTIAMLIAAETGRPLRRAFSELFFSVNYVRTLASQELVERDYSQEGIRARLVHRPLGVAAAIAPWNGPVILAVAKIANALLAGDTLVLRPAPQTPLSALYMGMIARDIFPAGVFNVITGDAGVGAALVEHRNVAKISFTGSTATGRLIAAAAAPGLKRLTLELGGNDAAIVLDDADLDAVAGAVYRISLENAGQFCAAIKRLYVHASVHDRLRDRIADLMQGAVAGSAFDRQSTLAPLQSAAQHSRVQGFLDNALLRGARRTGPDLSSSGVEVGGGFFMAPALVEGSDEDFALV